MESYLPHAVAEDAVGRERYVRLARRFLGMAIDPEATYAWGWEEVARLRARMEEVANLSLTAIDWRRSKLYVFNGKGQKDRVVYISHDTYEALVDYVKQRLSLRVKKVFLVQKGTHKGKPLSVRGIQKRMEYYAKKTGLPVSCHQLRHTMATQLLNADADLVSIQDLLGHSRIKTTQRYCRVSNLKVQRDYFKAIEEVIKRTTVNNNFT